MGKAEMNAAMAQVVMTEKAELHKGDFTEIE
jgi:hypothetical protein